MLELNAVRCAPASPLQQSEAVSIKVAAGEQIQLRFDSPAMHLCWLRCLAARQPPAAGAYRLDGRDVYGGNAAYRAAIRNRHIGLVDTHHPLLPQLNLQDNVAIAARYRRRVSHSRCKAEARQLLDTLGLGKDCRLAVGELSDDQRALALVARALINKPQLLLLNDSRLLAPSVEGVIARLLESNDYRELCIVSFLAKPLNWRTAGRQLSIGKTASPEEQHRAMA